MDTVSRAVRSRIMAAIKGKGTKPEKAFAMILKANGKRFIEQPRGIPGHPDFLVEPNVCVFVNGCFWHGCREHFKAPKSHAHFWRGKIRANIARQRMMKGLLRRIGYGVMTVWEHDLR